MAQSTTDESILSKIQRLVHEERHLYGQNDPSDHDQMRLEGAAMAPHANRCYLPVERSLLIPSIVRSFADEFDRHFNRGRQSCRDTIVPKMVDFDPSKGPSPTSVRGARTADSPDSRRLPQYKRTIVESCSSTLITRET
jgi:hypothetical protein